MLNNELKKNPFAVPDNYFDNLPSKVQNKCIVAKKSTVHGFIPKLAWSGIAILALVFFLSYFNNTSNNKKQNSTLQAIGTNNGISQSSNQHKHSADTYHDAKVDYLAVRNVNLNDYLASKY